MLKDDQRIGRMKRRPEQYAGASPKAIAAGSTAQMMYFVEDACADIATLLREIEHICEPQIVAVAVRRGYAVLTRAKPARHYDVISELRLLGVDPNDWEQGFLSSEGAFLTRWQARQLALRNGQCDKPRNSTELFSEDLW